ncbi:MAG: hypothetical protein LBQ92_03390, partial [Propionibacteriaceae bacterium]|jgi:serine/threonine protein kinase|nr:hypothetical protein [Propionibacteriaceae bacterium]
VLWETWPLSAEDVLAIGVRLAGALESAHKRGIRHADIKPGNILYDLDNKPMLRDFGIADLLASDGIVVPASPWSAPEFPDVSVRSEVWSLGATLRSLLTGKTPPWAGAPQVHPAIDQLLGKSVSAFETRYASAAEFGEAMRAVQAELGLAQTPMDVVPPGPAAEIPWYVDPAYRPGVAPQVAVAAPEPQTPPPAVAAPEPQAPPPAVAAPEPQSLPPTVAAPEPQSPRYDEPSPVETTARRALLEPIPPVVTAATAPIPDSVFRPEEPPQFAQPAPLPVSAAAELPKAEQPDKPSKPKKTPPSPQRVGLMLGLAALFVIIVGLATLYGVSSMNLLSAPVSTPTPSATETAAPTESPTAEPEPTETLAPEPTETPDAEGGSPLEPGAVYTWGGGSLSAGAANSDSGYSDIPDLSDVRAIAAGEKSAYALTDGGEVYAWGDNEYGQLGTSDNKSQQQPAQVSGLTDITAIAAGWGAAYAISSDGVLYGWGQSYLGTGDDQNSNEPAELDLDGVMAVSVSPNSGYALLDDGSVWGWGYYTPKSPGHWKVSEEPVRIDGLNNVVQIAGSWQSAYALDSQGNVYSWGMNNSGELGLGSDVSFSIDPMKVEIEGVSKLIATEDAAYALKTDGTVWAWGPAPALLGQQTLTPAQLPGLEGVSAIFGGYHGFWAQMEDGTVFHDGAEVPELFGATMITGADRSTPASYFAVRAE